MTNFVFIRSAAFIRGAVIGAVLVIAAAVITGACAAIMSSGDQHDVFSFKSVVALAVCAAAGAGILVVVNGIVNVVEGVGFTWPNALAHVEVLVTMALNLVVGCVVGAVCGIAFFDRVLANDLFFNAHGGASIGFGCACAMAAGCIAAWPLANR